MLTIAHQLTVTTVGGCSYYQWGWFCTQRQHRWFDHRLKSPFRHTNGIEISSLRLGVQSVDVTINNTFGKSWIEGLSDTVNYVDLNWKLVDSLLNVVFKMLAVKQQLQYYSPQQLQYLCMLPGDHPVIITKIRIVSKQSCNTITWPGMDTSKHWLLYDVRGVWLHSLNKVCLK